MKKGNRNPFAKPAIFLAVFFLTYMAWKVWVKGAGSSMLLIIAIMSIVTFAMYGKDKFAASHNRWRISENTLHIASLLGGWPGAALGQVMFHHKSSKRSFQSVYWATVLINIGVVHYLMF